MRRLDWWGRWCPGLASLLDYRKEYFKYDLKAGLSVAAVSLPVAIAYAELTGVGAIAGLYSIILPLIAYAIFGTSRQLIIGPDTATCAVVAAVVMPLAVDNPVMRWQLVIILTIMIGFWCIVAGKFRLGALADLLSRPILIGLLSGISATIVVDQLSKMTGFKYDYSNLLERVLYLPAKLTEIEIATLSVSVATLFILIVVNKLKPRWPAPLIAVVIMTIASWAMSFEQYDIDIIGKFSHEMIPLSSWREFDLALTRELMVPSVNIAVICFISMMITARSFASKNNYNIDADGEFKALGIANIVAGLSNGFVVSGTSSRTAVNDANGGKTQLVSIIAALFVAVVVFFFLSPLQYIPVAVLGVIIVYSSWSLIDIKSMIRFFKINRDAFYSSLGTFIAVLLLGIIPGMALAVLLGLFLFLKRIFRPTDQLLGIDKDGRIHSLGGDVKAIDNVIMYRFNSPLTYFNIAYFKKRITDLVDHALEPVHYVIVDAIPCFTYQDVSVLAGIDELTRAMRARNTVLVLAGRRRTLKNWFKEVGIKLDKNHIEFAYDLYFAVKVVESKEQMSDNADTTDELVAEQKSNEAMLSTTSQLQDLVSSEIPIEQSVEIAAVIDEDKGPSILLPTEEDRIDESINRNKQEQE